MVKKNDWSRGDVFSVPPEEIVLIGIDTQDGDDHVLAADPINRRPLDENMVRNVQALGVLEPIWARRVKVTDEAGETVERLECIFGRTRVLCAREANKRLEAVGQPPIKVPVIVKSLEEKALAAAILSENEMRRTTSPLEKARALQRAYARGITRDEASSIFGVVPASIQRWEQLLALKPSILYRVEEGEINATMALAVANLPVDQQEAALAKALEDLAEGGKRATGAKVKRGVASSHKPLSHRTLKKMYVEATERELLHPEARALLRWIVEGGKESEVEGLSTVVKALEEPKKKKAASGDAPKKRGRPRKEDSKPAKGKGKAAKGKAAKGKAAQAPKGVSRRKKAEEPSAEPAVEPADQDWGAPTEAQPEAQPEAQVAPGENLILF